MITPKVEELVRHGRRVAPAHRDGRELVAAVQAAADGDQRAWDVLVRELEPRIRSVARGFRLAPYDVEEVVQMTWVQLLAHIDAIRDPARLSGWLATTARRICFNLLQRRTSEVLTDDIEFDGDVPSADEVVIAEERREIVWAGVAALPEHQRRVLALLTTDPVPPYAEIAELLDMPIGSIGPTWLRSVMRLRRTPEIAALACA
jgi:RNA polymerase sigma factor (sigma-70 family)